MKFGIGQSTARVEDRRLLIGAGRYSDDIAPGQGLHVAFLRAPYAHAHLLNIDLEAAAADGRGSSCRNTGRS
jgi:carbon-monoxide dehydrogenase large subunit